MTSSPARVTVGIGVVLASATPRCSDILTDASSPVPGSQASVEITHRLCCGGLNARVIASGNCEPRHVNSRYGYSRLSGLAVGGSLKLMRTLVGHVEELGRLGSSNRACRDRGKIESIGRVGA